jgi:hypothetical protein
VPNRPITHSSVHRLLVGVAALVAMAAFATRARAQARPPVDQAPNCANPAPGSAQPVPPPGYYGQAPPPPGYYGQAPPPPPPPGYYGQPWSPPGYYGPPPPWYYAQPAEVAPSPEEQRRSDLEARARVRRILSYIGAGVLLGSYATGIGVSAADRFENGKKAMWIPVAGPWLTLANRRKPCEGQVGGDCWDSWGELFTIPFLFLDGVAQAAGAALLATAVALPDPKDVRAATVSVAPYARPGAGGLVFAGAF